MDAFEELGIGTEKMEDTQKKMVEEAEEVGIDLKHTRLDKEEAGKILYSITDVDREQAVYEKLIPEAYKNASFDIEKIRANIRGQYYKCNKLYKVYRFNEYASICEKILSMIRIRELPKRSYLIGAPNGFGKTSFVNECIITLRKQGFRTVPYITLWELAQIRADNEQRITNPYQKFEKRGDKVVYRDRPETDEFKKKPEIVTNSYSYSEYINADCLFVGFTNILSKEIESYTLYQLLAIRGAKGLPTIVTISTSIEIYETDPLLKEYVWDEIKNYDENKYCYDRVYHISCYKRKAYAIDSRDENVDNDTGIVG